MNLLCALWRFVFILLYTLIHLIFIYFFFVTYSNLFAFIFFTSLYLFSIILTYSIDHGCYRYGYDNDNTEMEDLESLP